MKCPRCESRLDERERHGITVDVCGSCRGIWLDRGELEKIIARNTQSLDDFPNDDTRPDGLNRERHDARRHAPRKKSWLESISEIFD